MDIKRIIALLLVFMLALALLCACNDNGKVETNGAPSQTEEKNDESCFELDSESDCESGNATSEEGSFPDDQGDDTSDEKNESETFGSYEEEEEWEGPIISA